MASVVVEPSVQFESLITYDIDSNTLTFNGSENSLSLGGSFTTIEITLVDKYGGSSQYVQQLQINAPTSLTTKTEEDETATTPTDVSAGGDEQASPMTIDLKSEWKNWRKERKKKAQESTTPVEVKIVIKEATSLGQISLAFDPPHVLVPRLWKTLPSEYDYAKLSDEDKDSLDEILAELVSFSFVQNSDELAQDRFDARITDFTESGIQIQANFSQPILVSQGSESQDQVEIHLLKDFFATPNPKYYEELKPPERRYLSHEDSGNIALRQLLSRDDDENDQDEASTVSLLVNFPRQVVS